MTDDDEIHLPTENGFNHLVALAELVIVPDEEIPQEFHTRGLPRSYMEQLNIELGYVYTMNLEDQITGVRSIKTCRITGLFIDGYAYVVLNDQ